MTTTIKRHLNLTLVDSVKTTQVKHLRENWDALAVRLTNKPIITTDRESLRWPLFVPFKMLTIEEGARTNDYGHGPTYSRCKANVVHMDCLVLDFDNDPKRGLQHFSTDQAKALFAPYAFCLYTSYNHQNPQKHLVDKFRVVLPLQDPVTLEEVQSRREALRQLFPSADPASFSASQPFYVPIAHPARASTHESYEGKGACFDLLVLEEAKRVEPEVTTTYQPTGELHDDLPVFKLKGGQSISAEALYTSLVEGYNHRKGCFRIDATDSKPGCFVYRRGTGLSYYDPAVGKSRFIPVLKTFRVPEENEAIAPTLTLVKKTSDPTVREREVIQIPKASPEIITNEPEIRLQRLNCRYLPEDLNEQLPTEGIVIIRSPKGTGKTELLKKVTADAAARYESIMLLGHRVYLLKNLAGRTNLDYYRDLEEGATTSSMALCMNSLTRIEPGVDKPYHTLIIDESEQVFQALINDIMRKEINKVFTTLVWLFQNAKRIIVLDADLSTELTIDLIDRIRGLQQHDNVLGIINDYQIGQGQTTKLYESRWHMVADMIQALHDGEKVFMTCNNKKFATHIHALATEMGKASLLISLDTNQDELVQAFIEDPTTEAAKYDLIAASPTLSTGVSIEGHHFTRVFGFFQLQPGTHQDADQAISRVRHCSDVSVWIQGNREYPHVESEREVWERIMDTERASVKALYGEAQHITKGQMLWADIYAQIAHLVKRWSVFKDVQFAQARKALGFTITPVGEDETLADAARTIYGSVKGTEADRAALIVNSPDLAYEDAKELRSKRQRTKDEQLQMERYELQEVLKDRFSIETVRKALKQELLYSVSKLFSMYVASDTDRSVKDKEDRERNEQTFTANRHRSVRYSLLRDLCSSANINLESLFTAAQNGKECELPRATLEAVAKAYGKRKKEFNFYFGSRIKDPTADGNLKKVWDATFAETYSLHLSVKKRGPKKGREKKYYLDTEKKDLVFARLKELQQFKIG